MYRKKVHGWMKHVDFLILDLISVHLALLISYVIRYHSLDIYTNQLYKNIILSITLINLLVSIVGNGFKNVLRRGMLVELYATVRQVCIVVLLLLVYLFLNKTTSLYSRQIIVGMFCLYLFISYIFRVIWKICIVRLWRASKHASLMLVTTSDMALQVIENVNKYSYSRYIITGLVIVDGNSRGEEIAGIPVVAGGDDAVKYICREWVDEVLIALPPELAVNEKLIFAFHQMGIVVHTALTQRVGKEGLSQQVGKLGNYIVLTSSIKYAGAFQLFVKRMMDIVGGLLGCLITLLLCVVIGPIIFINSPGSIFFSQVRVGKNGKKFKMYKFRSMYKDAEKRKNDLMGQNKANNNMMFKMDCDPRIIGSKILPDGTYKKGIGNFIRDCSLDEFPQFWNVLKGDMSLVGTRPPTFDEWENYEPWHRTRLAVKPGITGMWQVSGRSNITDFEEVVRLDTQYISQWSISLDIKILFKTIGVVLKREGSM